MYIFLLFLFLDFPTAHLVVSPWLDFSYLLRDDDLEGASNILSEIGLPITLPTELYLSIEGDFRAKGHFHRITRSTAVTSVQHLILYSLSFSTLSLSEMDSEEKHVTISLPPVVP